MNLSWARDILKDLGAQGVQEFVFCAGARNSPLVFALDRAKGVRAYSFFEERSASFFTLGLARRSGRPVAIITTSGTAAAELLPATIEAFHTGVPLILVTADRPKRLRGTGAPQAIDQTGLFAKFVEREFDLEKGQRVEYSNWSLRAPLHINICFDEPLIDEKLSEFSIDVAQNESFAGLARHVDPSATAAARSLEKFLASDASPSDLLIVVGTLETSRERDAVAKLVLQSGAPAYFESTSGLRERAELAARALRSGDKILPHALRDFGVKRVLRIGGVPTARVWRDLEEISTKAETFSLSSLPFPGLSRGQFFCSDIADVLAEVIVHRKSEGESALLKLDHELSAKLEQLFKDEPKAEPSLFRALSEKISTSSLVYVGNSLPIREWDFAATYKTAHAVEANRGVNGIDGQVSTFLGLATAEHESWCVIGDLTAMYDLAAPWAANQKNIGRATVAIINNGGGQIFHRMFKNELFENRHDFDFKNWAAQWRWDYERWAEIPANVSTEKPRIVEIVPDAQATTRFWDRYDAFFK